MSHILKAKEGRTACQQSKNGSCQQPRPRTYSYRREYYRTHEVAERPIDRVLSLLNVVNSYGDQHSALCPAHADSNASLSVSEGDDGRVLITCHRGCPLDEIVSAIDLTVQELFPGSHHNGDVSRDWHKPPEVRSRQPQKVAAENGDRQPAKPNNNRSRELRTAPGAASDWASLVREYKANLNKERLEELSRSLGIPCRALLSLHAGWNPDRDAWTFPEFSKPGEVIGITLRYKDGSKKAVRGSERGLYLPENFDDGDGPLFAVEGASDTAAGLAIELSVVGRPSSKGGAVLLTELFQSLPIDREVVVLGEMDSKPDGSWPGRDGAISVAQKLADELDRPVSWALPPGGAKDLRAWLTTHTLNDNREKLGRTFVERVLTQAHTVEPKHSGTRLDFVDTATFARADHRIDWLVNRALVAKQPAIMGGSKKTLKTSVVVDLSVSLGLGAPFLGYFRVPRPVRVGLISGESGQAVLQETYRRVLRSKLEGIRLAAMQQLLTGKHRLPGFTGKWITKAISEIATQSVEKNSEGHDLPVLTCSKHFGFVDSLSYFRNQVFSRNLKGYRIIRRDQIGYPANHIEEGSIGLQNLYDVAVVSPIYVIFSTDATVDSYFLYRLLKLDRYQQAFASATSSSVDRRGSLRWPEFSRIQVCVPSFEEQCAITTVLSDMDAELRSLTLQRDKASRIKQGMMQQLLTGRIRLVKAPEKITDIQVEPNKSHRSAHSKAFNEAVVISVLTKHFGSEQFPLGRKRYTKLSYLLHRRTDDDLRDYLKKAAGPYNPKTRYGGPERIAVENGYIRDHKSGAYSGFVAAEKIAEAEAYFEKWYGPDSIKWLEQFRYKKNDELELP